MICAYDPITTVQISELKNIYVCVLLALEECMHDCALVDFLLIVLVCECKSLRQSASHHTTMYYYLYK